METFEVADGVKKFTSQFLFVIRFESLSFTPILVNPLLPLPFYSLFTEYIYVQNYIKRIEKEKILDVT